MRMLIYVCLFGFLWSSVSAQTDVAHLLGSLTESSDNFTRLTVYEQLVEHYQFTDMDSAIYYLDKANDDFTRTGYKKGKAEVLSLLGGIYSRQGMMGKARYYYTEGLKLFSELKDPNGRANASNGLGVIEGKSGNYEKATRYFMSALKDFESRNNTTGIVSTYIKLGAVNDHSDNLDKALDYYKKGLEISKADPNSNNTPFLYNNIGAVYGRKGDYDTALIYLGKALETTQKPEFLQLRISPLRNLGNLYRDKGEDAKAMDYYSQAFQLAQRAQIPEEQTRLTLEMARIQSKTDPRKALGSLRKALNDAVELGDKNMRLDVISALKGLYAQIGDYKRAYEYSEQEQELADTVFNMDKATEIANLQSVYELDKSNAKLEQLQASEKRNKAKSDIIMVFATILLIAFIALAFFFWKTIGLNKMLINREAELEEANTVKDRLFSIIGHDLRGPVGNFAPLATICLDKETAEEERNYLLNAIHENALVTMETLDKLLNWGQSQISGIKLKQTVFNPREVLEEKLRLLKGLAEQKEINIVNRTPDNISIYADKDHFMFITRNLISNAIKFTHRNGLIELDADTESKPGFVVFSVKDDGVGMNREQMEKLFVTIGFTTAGTANEKGNSIGLMLCRDFVRQNGGQIWIESEKDKGSTFYFSLKAYV